MVDRIINPLKLTFIAEKPALSRIFQQVALIAAEERAEYFLKSGDFEMNGKSIVFRAIFRTSGTMIRTDGLFCGFFRVLDSIRVRDYPFS